MIERFTIDVSDAVITDLRERLRRTRFADQIPAAGWDHGTNATYLRELVAYWADKFEWRAHERRINTIPQYRTMIDGVGVHFAHVLGKGTNPIPLLMLHGWPATFTQFEKIIPLLTDPEAHGAPDAPSFTVVAPSLPGYGFSDIPRELGWNISRIAALMNALMVDRLGYARYGIRSSDMGAAISNVMLRRTPQSSIGCHTIPIAPPPAQPPSELTSEESAYLAASAIWARTEMAYAMEHWSKPQTIGNALNDSPAGLASWIVEKYRRWGDTNGEIESRFTKDALCTNLTIYWATSTITSSVRLYYELMRDPAVRERAPTSVPIGVLMSPHDFYPTPRSWVERFQPIARWAETARGGHFLEEEEPQLVAEELRAFFGSLTR